MGESSTESAEGQEGNDPQIAGDNDPGGADSPPAASAGTPGDVPDWVKNDPAGTYKLIQELRRKEAANRVKLKEIEPLAEKARKFEDEQKTEVERLTEQLASVTDEANKSKLEMTVLETSIKHGLPEECRDYLRAFPAEEMDERAQTLKSMFQRHAPANVGPEKDPKPGASPEPPKQPDYSYPPEWLPNRADK